MWVPQQLLELFAIGRDTVAELRQQVTVLTAERDSLKDQLRTASISGDWLRMQVNTLQFERTGLLEKAYGIRIPVPEIIRNPATGVPDETLSQMGFEHIGEDAAKKLGIAHLIS